LETKHNNPKFVTVIKGRKDYEERGGEGLRIGGNLQEQWIWHEHTPGWLMRN